MTDRLQDIQQDILNDMECPLKDAAKNLVFGKGNPDAEIMFIGEAPGRAEDEQGIPFVGRAGSELDRLLHSIGLSLKDVYIANVLKYRPPNNRDPKPDEIKRHAPFLSRQIRVIKPRVICTLGNFSTKFVLAGFSPEGMKNIEGVSKLHGKTRMVRVRGEEYKVIPLYHPAAMLYRPQLRKELEKDFRTIGDLLGRTQPTLKEWEEDPEEK